MLNIDCIIVYILVGFIAQIIDGSLGMAYGVSATTFLISLGMPIKVASASVHTAELFTTFVSGILHYKMQNIDKALFRRLVGAGIIGAIIGAISVTMFNDNMLSFFVSIYLLIMGGMIIYRVINQVSTRLVKTSKIISVGFWGGFFDAIGGGGWGPIVTSTMIASGYSARYVIGSVNMAEFFITMSQVIVFSTVIRIDEYIQVIICLAIGGSIAAPFAAILCRKISEKKMMLIVGLVIILLNIRNIFSIV